MKKIIPYCDEGCFFPTNYDVIGTIRQTFSRNALHNGWKIIEIEDDDILPDRP